MNGSSQGNPGRAPVDGAAPSGQSGAVPSGHVGAPSAQSEADRAGHSGAPSGQSDAVPSGHWGADPGTAAMSPGMAPVGAVISPRTGAAMLALATFFWGTTFMVVQKAVATFPPSAITLGRFAVGSLALAPFFRRDWRLWRDGAELSLWLFAGYATQAIGLQYTTTSRSAFITALNVIFVPLMGLLIGRGVKPIVWWCAVGAVVGTALLSYDGGAPNGGDLWTLGTAITYGAYIVRMERLAPKYPALAFSLAQLVGVTVLSAIWVGWERPAVGGVPWYSIIYLGLMATALTTWLGAVGQKVVSGARVAVIYTTEPVWAMVFAFVILGEMLGARGLAGAGLIVVSAIVAGRSS